MLSHVSAIGAILIVGAPGSGKSAVIEALGNLLVDDDVEHGALEAEQLAWGHPWLSLGDTLPQLAAVLSEQRNLGRRLFVLTATPETDDDLAALVAALSAEPVMVVALRARPETVAARILDREPDHWAGRQALADHARTLALAIPHFRRVDMILDTDATPPLDVARAIHAQLLARGRGAASSDRGRSGAQGSEAADDHPRTIEGIADQEEAELRTLVESRGSDWIVTVDEVGGGWQVQVERAGLVVAEWWDRVRLEALTSALSAVHRGELDR